MTIRQRILKTIYPLLMKLAGMKDKRNVTRNTAAVAPPVSFYTLQATANNGQPFDFASLKGQYVLLVNTASECGYTAQYAELEALHRQYGRQLKVIGFPSNDFGGQEPGSDADIASFCEVNFGVSFPLMKKAAVTGAAQQPVYQWLTSPAANGWNQQAPTWNFCKYLVSPQGELLQFFPSGISPLDESITRYLQ
jgi:glutathione peroxidase